MQLTPHCHLTSAPLQMVRRLYHLYCSSLSLFTRVPQLLPQSSHDMHTLNLLDTVRNRCLNKLSPNSLWCLPPNAKIFTCGWFKHLNCVFITEWMWIEVHYYLLKLMRRWGDCLYRDPDTGPTNHHRTTAAILRPSPRRPQICSTHHQRGCG